MERQIAFLIGDAARASGLTVKTIRYYEEIGLIPEAARTQGGPHVSHRIYNEAQVSRMQFIHHARLFGLPLADIRELLALADGKGCPSGQPEYQEIFTRHLRQIDDRIQHLLGLRKAIEQLILPGERFMEKKCSWGTCACMGNSGSSISSTKEGGKHV
jgi:DNA-binding transcriptional MerR regulator